MKVTLIAGLILATLSVSALANNGTPEDRKFFCEIASIALQGEDTGADVAVDMEKCLKGKVSLKAGLAEGVTIFKGKIPFNTPYASVTQTCTFPLIGAARTLDNVLMEAYTCK